MPDHRSKEDFHNKFQMKQFKILVTGKALSQVISDAG